MNVLQKIILFIGMLVGLLVLVSCGSSKSKTTTGDIEAEDTTVVDDLTVAYNPTVADSTVVDDLTVADSTVADSTVADSTVVDDLTVADSTLVDTPIVSDPTLVPITASEVTDEASLKAFALSAKSHLEENYEGAVQEFETEEWQKCSSYSFFSTKCTTYLYVFDMNFNVLFNSISLGWTPTTEVSHWWDKGQHRKKIKKVAESGGGFVQHDWDENVTSYAVLFEKQGVQHILVAVYVQQEQDTEQSEEDTSE